jgi:hypothetical protein
VSKDLAKETVNMTKSRTDPFLKSLFIFIKISCAAFLLIILAGCLGRTVITDVYATLELRKGVACRQQPDWPVEYTLIETDLMNQRALIQINDTRQKITNEGWVNIDGYASFSPIVGRHGLELIHMDADVVMIKLLDRD